MDTAVIPKIREAGYNDVAERLVTCGTFINCIECSACGSKHFAGFLRCKSRWCLPCARVRHLLWFGRVMETIRTLDIRYINHLVLTHRNMDDLARMVRLMGEYWRSFVNGNKESRNLFKARFQGYVRNVEVKLGANSGKWHVHFHVLLVSYDYGRDYDWIHEGWKEVTCGEGSAQIRGVSCREKVALECTKYILKPARYSASDWNSILSALTGVRQITTGGIFRGYEKIVERDMERIEEEKLRRFVCALCGCTEGELITIERELIGDEILWDCP